MSASPVVTRLNERPTNDALAASLRSVNGSRRCVFCGSADLTKEHVWPRWLSEALGGNGPLRFERQGLGDEPRAWARVSLDVTVGVVCRECNNGWLSDLEDAAKPLLEPLIRGESVTLTPEESKTVALWCVKTALLFQYTHPERRSAPDWHYRWLFEKRTPPPNVFVWLAGYSGSYWEGWYLHQLLLLRDPDGIDRSEKEKGYCATITAGALVFQVIGLDADSTLDLEKASIHEPYIVQVWPLRDETATLPPPQLLHDSALAFFADPFNAERGVVTPRPPA